MYEPLITGKGVAQGKTLADAIKKAKYKLLVDFFTTEGPGTIDEYIKEHEFFKKADFLLIDDSMIPPFEFANINEIFKNPEYIQFPSNAGQDKDGINIVEVVNGGFKVTIENIRIRINEIRGFLGSKKFLVCKNGLEWPCGEEGEEPVELPSHVFADDKTGEAIHMMDESKWNPVQKAFAVHEGNNPSTPISFYAKPKTYVMAEPSGKEWIKIKMLSGENSGQTGFAYLNDLVACGKECRDIYKAVKKLEQFKPDLKAKRNLFVDNEIKANLLNLSDHTTELDASLATKTPFTHFVAIPSIVNAIENGIFTSNGKLRLFTSSDLEGFKTITKRNNAKLVDDGTLLQIIKQNVTPPKNLLDNLWSKNKRNRASFLKEIKVKNKLERNILYGNFHLVRRIKEDSVDVGYVWAPYIYPIGTPQMEYQTIPTVQIKEIPYADSEPHSFMEREIDLPYLYFPFKERDFDDLSHAEFRIHVTLEGIPKFNAGIDDYLKKLKLNASLKIISFYGRQIDITDPQESQILTNSYGTPDFGLDGTPLILADVVADSNQTQNFAKIRELRLTPQTDTVHALVSVPVRFIEAIPEDKAIFKYTNESDLLEVAKIDPVSFLTEETKDADWYTPFISKKKGTKAKVEEIQERSKHLIDTITKNPLFNGKRVYFTVDFDNLEKLKEESKKFRDKVIPHYSHEIANSNHTVRKKFFTKFKDTKGGPGGVGEDRYLDEVLKLENYDEKIENYVSAVELIIDMNGYTKEDKKSAFIELGFDKHYKLLFVIFGGRRLKISTSYYFKKPPFTKPTTNAFIHRLDEINKEYQGSLGDPPDWLTWIESWVYPLGKVEPNTSPNTYDEGDEEDTEPDPNKETKVKTEGQLAKEEKDLTDAAKLNKKNKKAVDTTYDIYDRNLTEFREVSKRLRTLENAYEFFLNNADIKLLAETIFKCIIKKDLVKVEEELMNSAFVSMFGSEGEAAQYIKELMDVVPEECMLLLLKNIFVIQPEIDESGDTTDDAATGNGPQGEWKILGVAGKNPAYVSLTESPLDKLSYKVDLSGFEGTPSLPVYDSPTETANVLFLLNDGDTLRDEEDKSLKNDWFSITVETPQNQQGKKGFIQQKYVTQLFPENAKALKEGTQFDKIAGSDIMSEGVVKFWKIVVKTGVYKNSEGYIEPIFVKPTSNVDSNLDDVIIGQGDQDGEISLTGVQLTNQVETWQRFLNSPEVDGGPEQVDTNTSGPTTGANLTADGVFGPKTAAATKEIKREDDYQPPDVRVKDFNKALIWQNSSTKDLFSKPLSDIEGELYLPTPLSPLGELTYAPPGFFAGKTSACDFSYAKLVRQTRNLEIMKLEAKEDQKLQGKVDKLKKEIAVTKTEYAACMQQYDFKTQGSDKEFMGAKDANLEQIVKEASFTIYNAGTQCIFEYDDLVKSLGEKYEWPGTANATPEQQKAFGKWISCVQKKTGETEKKIKDKQNESGNTKVDYAKLAKVDKMTTPFPTNEKELFKYVMLYQDLPTNIVLKENAGRIAVKTLQSGACQKEIEQLLDWITSELAPNRPEVNAIVKIVAASALLAAEFATEESPSFSSFVTKKLGLMNVDKTGAEAKENMKKTLKRVAQQVVLQNLRIMFREISEICENAMLDLSPLKEDIPLVKEASSELADKLKNLIDEYGVNLAPGQDENNDTPPTSDGLFDVLEFLNNMTEGLTVQQKCNLVNGKYSDLLFQKIRLNIKKYYPVSIQQYFADDDVLESFFNDLSPIIGDSICDEKNPNINPNLPLDMAVLAGLCSPLEMQDQKKTELIDSGVSPEMADWVLDQEAISALDKMTDLASLLADPEQYVDDKTPEPCEILNESFKNDSRIRRGIKDVILSATEEINVAFANEAAFVVPFYTTPAELQRYDEDQLKTAAAKLNPADPSFKHATVDSEGPSAGYKDTFDMGDELASAIESGKTSGLDDINKILNKGLTIPKTLPNTPLQNIKESIVSGSIGVDDPDPYVPGETRFAIGDENITLFYTPQRSPLLANVAKTTVTNIPVVVGKSKDYTFFQEKPLSADVQTFLAQEDAEFSTQMYPNQQLAFSKIVSNRLKKSIKSQLKDGIELDGDLYGSAPSLWKAITIDSIKRYSRIIADSKYFRLENMKTIKFIPSQKDLLEMCSKPEVFDLDSDMFGLNSLVEKYIERFFEINDFCDEPEEGELDATSQTMLEASMDLLMRACILDTFFTGIFAMSKFDLGETIKSSIVRNYFFVEFKNSLDVINKQIISAGRRTTSQNLYFLFKHRAEKIVYERKEAGETINAVSKPQCLKYLFFEKIEEISPIIQSVASLGGLTAEESLFAFLVKDIIPIAGIPKFGDPNVFFGQKPLTSPSWAIENPRYKLEDFEETNYVTNSNWDGASIKGLSGNFFIEQYIFVEDKLDSHGDSKWDKAMENLSFKEGVDDGSFELLKPQLYLQYNPAKPEKLRRGDWLRNYVRIDDWERYFNFLYEITEIVGLYAADKNKLRKILKEPWTEYFKIKIGMRLIHTTPRTVQGFASQDAKIFYESIDSHVFGFSVNDPNALVDTNKVPFGGILTWRTRENGVSYFSAPLCEMNTTKFNNDWLSYKKTQTPTVFEGPVTRGDPWKLVHFKYSNANLSKILSKEVNQSKLRKLFIKTPQFQAMSKLAMPFNDHMALATVRSMMTVKENMMIKDFLLHTKLVAKALVEMSAAGNVIEYQDPASNPIGLAKPLDPNDTGNQIWPLVAKFIWQTPLQIVKGVAEVIDPNIQATKAIYEFANTTSKSVKADQKKNLEEEYKDYKADIPAEEADSFEQWAAKNDKDVPNPEVNIPPGIAPFISLSLLPSAIPYGVGFPPPPLGPGLGPPMTPFAIPYLAFGLIGDDYLKKFSPNAKADDQKDVLCDTPYTNALEQLPVPEEDTDEESDIL